jgi:hypothetical protein
MKMVAVVVLWILSLLGIFFAGTRIGARENWLALSEYRAAITAGRLRFMDEDRVKELRELLELQLDDDLVQHSYYLESGWKWLWPGLQSDLHAIKSATAYRAAHPYKEPDLSDPKNRAAGVIPDDAFLVAVAQGQRDNQARIERVVRLYASP